MNIFSSFYSNRYSRILTILLVSIGCLSCVYVTLSYQHQIDAFKTAEIKKLHTITETVSLNIRYDDVKNYFNSHEKNDYLIKADHPFFIHYMNYLKKVKVKNELDADIIILSIDDRNGLLKEGFRSSYAHHRYNKARIQVIEALYHQGGTQIIDDKGNGKWLLCLSPIKNETGETEASILLQESINPVLWKARKSFIQNTTSMLIVIIIFGYFLFMILQDFFSKESYREKMILKNTELIEYQKDQIVSSIQYAKHIQNAILPQLNTIQESFHNAFVLYEPKNIVSGDFYWFGKKGGKQFIIAADCAGHGVPGAFMSMIGNSIVGECVFELNITEANQLLNKMEELLRKRFEQDDSFNHEGIDLAICIIDQNLREIDYAGAFRPLYLVRTGELTEFKPDRTSLGGDKPSYFTSYTKTIINYNSGDRIYLSSDGFADQFGGENNKKITTKQLKQFICDIQEENMETQKNTLYQYFCDWRGQEQQVDDILIIGIEL